MFIRAQVQHDTNEDEDEEETNTPSIFHYTGDVIYAYIQTLTEEQKGNYS